MKNKKDHSKAILERIVGTKRKTDLAEKLTDGNNESKVTLIECYYQIKGTGTLSISADNEENDLSLTGRGKYGLRPDQLKFGNDAKIKLTTDSNIESYLLITEFRRN